MARQMKDSGFEWIGEIPANWEVRKVKHYYNIQTGFTPDTKNELFYDDVNGYDWVNISDIDDGKTVLETKKKVSRHYIDLFNPSLIPEGSLLYSFKLSVGQTAFAGKALYSNEAIASFIPSVNVNLRYLRYSSMFIIENAQTNIYSAKILNQDLIKNAYIVFPPLTEQKIIADYLDSQCAKIDTVIAKTKAAIEEYKKLKQSIITEAVTKGIHRDRPMKDSGIEWIGDIPADWNMVKITRLLDYSVSYPIGDGDHGLISPSDYMDTGVPYLRVQNLGFGTPISHKGLVYISPETNEKIKGSILRPNDVLFAKTGATIGKTGIIPETMPIANTTSHIGKITVSSAYNPMWVLYVLSSNIGYRQFWEIAAQKTTRPELSIAETKSIKLLIPSERIEQDEIVEYLGKKCVEMDTLIAKKTTLLEELESYKKSVIYEYVTGKKEVP